MICPHSLTAKEKKSMSMRTWRVSAAAGCALLALAVAAPRHVTAATMTYAAYIYDPAGKQLGQATFVGVDTGGVLVRIDVSGLPPGRHGLHIHEVGSCNPLRDTAGVVTPFGAAGGHFDPQGTGHHLGPSGPGHAGDFANLIVGANGHARTTFFTDRLSVLDGPTDIVGRALMIHANEDNSTDTPPNGGSGPRIACGEIGPLRAQ
jgi:Cu-Zn family superoxide dismutase